MQLALNQTDTDFRDRMREFFTTKVPQEIRDTVLEGRHLTRDQIVETQQILNAEGLAVPHWPVEWGGQDWTDLQRHLWHEEMQRAGVPIPLAFNASMIGPVIAQFGNDEQKQRFLPDTANLDIWWQACEPQRCVTATTGSSTVRRRGRPWVSSATGSSCSCGPTPRSRSRPGSRCSSST